MSRRRTRLAIVATMLLGGLVAGPGVATAAAACDNTKATPGTLPREDKIGARSYLIKVPTGLTKTKQVPLLLGLHGAASLATAVQAAMGHRGDTGWDALASTKDFIVAYPAAGRVNPTSWNANKGSADVTFLKAVVKQISTSFCINPKRVYIEGHSSGGIMAERMACDAAGTFAAAAAYAANSPSLSTGTACEPSRKISVGIFQSTLDPLSSLAIGVLNRNEWRTRNECPANPTTEPGVLVAASSWACASGSEVVWRLYAIEGHEWPRGATDNADIRNRMWSFFTRNPRP